MDKLDAMKSKDADIKYPYNNHPFVAMTFNVGPVALSIPHMDGLDFPCGLCRVTVTNTNITRSNS